jgi:hypothetical protein
MRPKSPKVGEIESLKAQKYSNGIDFSNGGHEKLKDLKTL